MEKSTSIGEMHGVTRWYEATLQLIRDLIDLQPTPDSPEGILLHELACAVENYEKKFFPFHLTSEGNGG